MKRTLLFAVLAGLAGCGPTQGADGPRGLSGPTGMRGEKGDPGPGFDPTPAIAAVTPSLAVVGQTVDIAITGSATEWSSGAIVSFGAGITVVKVASPSPVALIATITVDKTAMPGTRDITVTQNGKQATWKGAFNISPLYRAEVLGKPGRGSLAMVRIVSNDPDFTFDTSWNGSTYLGVRASSSPSSLIVVHDVKPRQVDLLITGDVDSALGMRDLRLVNQFGRPSERTFIFPALYDFADLSEQSVDAGTPIVSAFPQPYGSAQFKFQASGSEVVASVTSTGGNGAPVGHPMLALMSSTGKFTGQTVNLVNNVTFFPYLSTPYYFVVFDPSGASGFNFTFSVNTLTKVVEVEPNDNKETAFALTNLPAVQTASFNSATDVDWFKVNVTEAEIGRHLRVRTRYSGHYNTDSKVEVFRPDGTLFGASADTNYFEELRTDALSSAGEWTIKISYGAYYPPWASYKANYELLVNWE